MLRSASIPLLVVLLAGCAGIGPSRLDDPLARIESEVAGFNAEELFACGSAAFQAEDFRRAAICFSRLVERHPDSPHAADARFNAGAAYESLGAFQLALDSYRPLLRSPQPARDLEVLWRVATCLYQLGAYDEAIALLEPVAERGDVRAVDRIHARTHAGVCKVEKGDLAAAEADFRKALSLHRAAAGEERMETYFPSQAQFFLGEIYRIHFAGAPLDAVDSPETMRDQIEY
ncbi:MAG TPA: tetratricopeptide repeat protein, partial [Vulgatibacter sp.]